MAAGWVAGSRLTKGMDAAALLSDVCLAGQNLVVSLLSREKMFSETELYIPV